MRLKKLIAIITMIVCSFLFLFYSASSEYVNSENGYIAIVLDDAHLLKEGEEQIVLQSMQPMTQWCNVLFFTSDEASDLDVLKKAELRAGNLFGEAPFSVFIIDMYTRRIGIYSSTEVKKAITVYVANVITDEVYRYASKNEFGECAINAFGKMTAVMEKPSEDGMNIERPVARPVIAMEPSERFKKYRKALMDNAWECCASSGTIHDGGMVSVDGLTKDAGKIHLPDDRFVLYEDASGRILMTYVLPNEETRPLFVYEVVFAPEMDTFILLSESAVLMYRVVGNGT